MRKLSGLLLLGILFTLFVLSYLNYDKRGYYYGNGCTFCHEKLPFSVEPKYYPDYPQRFYLLDADGFELAGIGFRFENTGFTIKGLPAYGYNDTSIMVKCKDSLANTKYLVSYKTGYKSKKGTTDISFKSINDHAVAQSKNNYKWVEVDEETTNEIGLFKLAFMLGSILFLLFMISKLFRPGNRFL